jgi:hypothetical protein
MKVLPSRQLTCGALTQSTFAQVSGSQRARFIAATDLDPVIAALSVGGSFLRRAGNCRVCLQMSST